MIANTKQVRAIVAQVTHTMNTFSGTWTDKTSASNLNARSVSFQFNGHSRLGLLMAVKFALTAAGYANKVKVTDGDLQGNSRFSGCGPYLRIAAVIG